MNDNNRGRGKNKDTPDSAVSDEESQAIQDHPYQDVTGLLDERIRNLQEAIDEIDAALAHRKVLNVAFLAQIDREAEEVKRHLNMLQEPWKMGFKPEVEFLRMSFHKSLTSRAKEGRSERLKYWENSVNLAKERRKFLDELKELIAAKKRLEET